MLLRVSENFINSSGLRTTTMNDKVSVTLITKNEVERIWKLRRFRKGQQCQNIEMKCILSPIFLCLLKLH